MKDNKNPAQNGPFEQQGWKLNGAKQGGANESGKYGGVYKNSAGKNAMIKCEKYSYKNISEFLGSQIFAITAPGSGAKVSFIVPDEEQNKVGELSQEKPNPSNIYVKSDYFDNYTDMYKDMDKNMSETTKPNSWFRVKGGKPLMMGTRNILNDTINNAFKER